ncbi:uncharacterized protein JN550_013114 [Neoarthrinium moseri]|uniref:uncharacterized protein n=1 Tax=Neoarthrinium moseri TaxID=1658444 RepID=UPI001FDE1E1E|nr:uncharacterized protein JN550_013114 [Neoarthrinium moseri]KAI1857602.1 hypothetical protein JN550_013114 [Neoarthrinium moseri]
MPENSILRNPPAPPSPTQAGIVPNCEVWVQVNKGDFCRQIGLNINMPYTNFCNMNKAVLGFDCNNCDQGLWAGFWYCMGLSGSSSATSQVITIKPTYPASPLGSKTESAVTTKPTGGSSPSVTAVTTSQASSATSQPTSKPTSLVTSPSPAGSTSKTPSPASSPASSSSAAAPAPNNGGIVAPGGSSYVGCVSEINGGRTLNAWSTARADMSIDLCLSLCSKQGLPFAGVEYGNECFCGTQLAPAARVDPGAGFCDMRCGGNKAQVCGGRSLLSVFKNASMAGPAIPPKAGDGGAFAFAGCYEESSPRALPAAVTNDGGMTVDACARFCDRQGFAFAGLEYGRECWCAKAITPAARKTDDGRCDMQCAGAAGSQYCGGSGAIQIYSKAGAKKRSPGPDHVTRVGGDGRPTVVKTVRMVRRGRFGRREKYGF